MPANSLDLIESASTTWSWKPTTDGVTGLAEIRPPRVNPYAAPQTIDRSIDEWIPVAECADAAGSRRMFPERSTAALVALFQRSRAIFNAQVAWFYVDVLVAFFGIMAGQRRDFDGVFDLQRWLPVAIAWALALIRWQAGKSRQRSDRSCALGLDALLLAGCVALVFWAMTLDTSRQPEADGRTHAQLIAHLVFLAIISPFIFFPGYCSFQSMRALLRGELLFGPARMKHEELAEELDYRLKWGIE